MAEAYEGQVYQFLEMSKRRAQDFASDGFVRDELLKIADGDQKASFVLSQHFINNKNLWTSPSMTFLKIDGSFIRKLHENRNDQLFVKAITDVAKGMGIRTVAEFVERHETARLLREFGVDYAQGHAIGRPAPEPLS